MMHQGRASVSPSKTFIFFAVPSPTSSISIFLLPVIEASLGKGCGKGGLEPFFRRTSPVTSLAAFDASSNLAFCAVADSPRIDPSIPLRGFVPSTEPVPVGSLIDTGG